MKNALLLISMLAPSLSFAASHTPAEYAGCSETAQKAVATIAALSFQLKPNTEFRPTQRVLSDEETGQIGYLIDMENSQGMILNGSRDGSSAYLVKLDASVDGAGKVNGCFINSVTFADEPSDSPQEGE